MYWAQTWCCWRPQSLHTTNLQQINATYTSHRHMERISTLTKCLGSITVMLQTYNKAVVGWTLNLSHIATNITWMLLGQVTVLLLFSSGARSRIIHNRLRWDQHPSGNWVLFRVRWTEKWRDYPHQNGGCVHLPIPDIQSSSVPASPLPDHIADMWPVQAGLGSSLFCCGTMPTLMCPPVQRRESRVLCKSVKSLSWSLFTYVAWGTAGLAILLHLRAQWWRITVLAVLKSTGAADCGKVETGDCLGDNQSPRSTQPLTPSRQVNWVLACLAGVKRGHIRLCRVTDNNIWSHMILWNFPWIGTDRHC